MQGQRSSMNALPENLFFDDVSILSSDSVVGTQLPWNNNLGTYEQTRLEYTLPSNQNSLHVSQHSGLYGQNVEWSTGESSSNASQRQENHLRKPEDSWNFGSQGVLSFENRQYEPSGSSLSLVSNAELSLGSNQTTVMRFVSANPSSSQLPQDLNLSSGFANNGNCQVIERSKGSYVPNRSINRQTQPNGISLEDQCTSRKRKALELTSCGEGNSNYFESHAETSQRRAQIATRNTNISLQAENDTIALSEPATSRRRLVINEAIPSSPFSLSTSGNAESSRRNLRLRVNGSTHQNPQLESSIYSNVDNSSSHHSSTLIRNGCLDLNPTPVIENVNVVHTPLLQRNPQPRWRFDISSSSSSHVSEEGNLAMLEPSASTNIPQHPIFLSSTEIGNTSLNPTYLNMVNGNHNISQNLASASRARPSTALNSSNRTILQRPRRQSEMVRRSLLSSSGNASIGQSSSNGARLSSSGLDNRAGSVMLERHMNPTAGLSRYMRTSAMPEHVRRILDTMRRGEGLRVEDMMILQHSAFFAMADLHDRHRDMRMDVDNMSYEELLALEERIGNVCTGLSEETIMKHMKQHKFMSNSAGDPGEGEQCSICREEYIEGEDLGKLECGHDFHRDCIKQWLMQKNLCPICKTTGLKM